MKKHFLTGLILILPVAITFVIIAFFINFLTSPFLITTENALDYYGVIGIENPTLLLYGSKLLILVVLFAITMVLGLLGHWFFEHYFIRLTNMVFERIPLVNKIYKTCQEIVNTLFTPKSTSFSKVVLVPFPSDTSRSFGLITRDSLTEGSSPEISQLVTVLVPGTPNPTMGFVLLYPALDLIPLDMKPDEALKAIVSCGIIMTDFNPIGNHE